MNESRKRTSLDDALLADEDDGEREECLRACAEYESLRSEYERLEEALRHARQPVKPPTGWEQAVLERIKRADSEKTAVVSLEDERRKRTRGSGAPPLATVTRRVEALIPGGQIAGKYRLEQQISAGGSGPVWIAVHEVTGREVALKVLARSEPGERGAAWAHLRDITSLKHRNIVDVFDLQRTQAGDPLLVMELLQGETLADLFMRRGRLEPREAVSIARDVARALAAAHDKAILHLDITPRNIFLHREPGHDGEPVVKVLGFGLKDAAVSSAVRSRASDASQSISYMSPERLRSDEDLDHRADIWSLGVVLFELLAGFRPFMGLASQVLPRILNGRPLPLEACGRPIRPELVHLVARCLEHERSERHRTTAELAEELGRVAALLPAPEPPGVQPSEGETCPDEKEGAAAPSPLEEGAAPEARDEEQCAPPAEANAAVNLEPAGGLPAREGAAVDTRSTEHVTRKPWIGSLTGFAAATVLGVGLLVLVLRPGEPTPPPVSSEPDGLLPPPAALPQYPPEVNPAAEPMHEAEPVRKALPPAAVPKKPATTPKNPPKAAAPPGASTTSARPLPSGAAAAPQGPPPKQGSTPNWGF